MRSIVVAISFLGGIVAAQQTVWGQCGGTGWTGYTSCVDGSYCTTLNPYYAQCTPGTAPATSTTATTTRASSSTTTTKTSSSSTPTSTGKTKFAGVNIAGFDFGCQTDGTCVANQAYGPVPPWGPDGAGQMQHFVTDDKLNIFRLPVGWQFLTNNVIGALNATNLASYDLLVQSCLATGAYCIIDIHNYARWNGAIIGQGGPTNSQFADFWAQLAAKYKSENRILFGIMNEPHDVPSVTIWAQTVQAAVTAIRQAGATSQMITLPGNNWQAASALVSDGSGAALLAVTNPDGSTTNLIFDVHKYLDPNNSGVGDCATNNIDGAFAPLATWLRQNKRQAILTETGGPYYSANCKTYLCQQFSYLNQNADVYLGYLGWGAGSFTTTVDLSETPTHNSNGTWTDQPLVAACLSRA